MKLISAGLGKYVDNATREPAILCVVTIGLNTEFLNGIGIRQDVAGVAQAGHVVAAIEIVVY